MKILNSLILILAFTASTLAQKAKPAAKPVPAKPTAPSAVRAAPEAEGAAGTAAPVVAAPPNALEAAKMEFEAESIYVVGTYRPTKLTYRFNQKAALFSITEFPVEYERSVSEGGIGVGYLVFGSLFGKVYWGLDQAATYSAILSNNSKYRVVSTGAETALANFSQNTVSYNINPLFGFQVGDGMGIFAGGGVSMHYQLAAMLNGAKVSPSLDALYINGFATAGIHWLIGKIVLSPQFRYDFYLGGIYNGAASSSLLSTGGNISSMIKAGTQIEIRLAVGYNFAK